MGRYVHNSQTLQTYVDLDTIHVLIRGWSSSLIFIYIQFLGPQMKADEACECFGVDQAIHMDSLNAFIDSQISASNKNSMFWYDYLNPSHRQIHAKVMRFVQGTEMAHHSVHSPTQPIQQLRLIKKNREKDIMKRTCQIGEYNEFIYFAKPITVF